MNSTSEKQTHIAPDQSYLIVVSYKLTVREIFFILVYCDLLVFL